jgi:hypothetical protein
MGIFGLKLSIIGICLVKCRNCPKVTKIGLYLDFVYEVEQCPLVWPYIPNQEDQ